MISELRWSNSQLFNISECGEYYYNISILVVNFINETILKFCLFIGAPWDSEPWIRHYSVKASDVNLPKKKWRELGNITFSLIFSFCWISSQFWIKISDLNYEFSHVFYILIFLSKQDFWSFYFRLIFDIWVFYSKVNWKHLFEL